jgi:hypothetical protein
MIFGKSAKSIQWGKGQSFLTNGTAKTGYEQIKK